jgi:hypothetical protein
MSKQLQEFLEVLDSSDPKLLNIKISSKKNVSVSPLTFKQQKSLITTGMDGFGGVMVFIKTLNDIILHNSNETDLKIYDRIPIVLALRQDLTSKKIIKDDIEIDVFDLISQFKKFELDESLVIDGDGYSITLKIPTLAQENKLLSTCIEDIKKINDNDIGKNISTILTYEIPKFIDSISFRDNTIVMDNISMSDKIKIMDNLPANITNKITDFILKIREYDEFLLTYNGVTVDIDSSFFE